MVSTRASSRAASVLPEDIPIPPTPSTTRKTKRNSTMVAKKAERRSSGWHHAPSSTTIFWMAISLPLVAWDTGYVLLRPLTMEGGSLHWPLYVPYKLYGQVDHVYGWEALEAKNGFTGAQSFLNVVETLMYLVYLWYFWRRGEKILVNGELRRCISGRTGAFATLVGFSAAVMSLSKTVLYWANEYYSGFDNIGHNPFIDLIYLWIIPNGAWLVFPAYMVWSIGGEIIDGLAGPDHSKRE
ncbi:Fc.00g107820.m01.CDS01 [Cosmosporella sp. VM-42]